ncbi:MAG: hypothetical protein NC120_01645 [Ruminococcus sp.]|nr:hypothetical protein [Ruminococcus sp.]
MKKCICALLAVFLAVSVCCISVSAAEARYVYTTNAVDNAGFDSSAVEITAADYVRANPL